MNRYKLLIENEKQILTSVKRIIREGKKLTDAERAEREAKKAARLTFAESEPFLVDMWNIHVKGGEVPKKYAERGLDTLFDAIKPYAKSPIVRIGDKKLSTSDLWKDVTGKLVDTSKTDVQGDKNYSVKYGPAQLMGGAPLEARATFFVAAEKAGLAEESRKIANGLLTELEKYAFYTIGKTMNLKALRNYESEEKLRNEQNKIAYNTILKGEELQKKLQEEMQKLFDNSSKFQREFIYEAMTGKMKFSDTKAIADTMLCIDKTAKILKVESVIDSSSGYVDKVITATKIRVDYKGGLKKDESGYYFNTGLRLQVKDLTEAVNEHLLAVNKYNSNTLNENFLDFVKKTWKKLKDAFKKMKEFILKGIEYIKAGFVKLLEFFGIDFDVDGWQKLDVIDLYDVA